MGKKFIAVLVGVVLSTVIFLALESVGHRLYPPPSGVNFHDPAAIKAYMAALPVGALLLVLLAYAVGSLTGGLVATLIAGRAGITPALIVGAVLTALGVTNLVSIPQPLWFAISSTLLYIPFSWLGSRVLIVRQGPS
jgi:hypothetical protein